MARYPTMTTVDGRYSVEVMTIRGRQSFRVKRLDTVMAAGSGWTPTGRLCRSVEEVKAILGDSFATLTEKRKRRFEGGLQTRAGS